MTAHMSNHHNCWRLLLAGLAALVAVLGLRHVMPRDRAALLQAAQEREDATHPHAAPHRAHPGQELWLEADSQRWGAPVLRTLTLWILRSWPRLVPCGAPPLALVVASAEAAPNGRTLALCFAACRHAASVPPSPALVNLR